MPIIKPISDLRNNFNEISEICHTQGEPVFITKNGKGDLVIMSIAKYEQIEALLDLYHKLGIAEEQALEKEGRMNHDVLMEQLRQKINGKQV